MLNVSTWLGVFRETAKGTLPISLTDSPWSYKYPNGSTVQASYLPWDGGQEEMLDAIIDLGADHGVVNSGEAWEPSLHASLHHVICEWNSCSGSGSGKWLNFVSCDTACFFFNPS